jgi:hypothetical protein
MSMPNELRHKQQGRGYARYVGRVGGLAVALGIGVAIANSPGIAYADEGGSGSSSESSGSSASAGAKDAPSTKKSVEESPSAKKSVEKRASDEKTPDEKTPNEKTSDEKTRAQESGSVTSQADAAASVANGAPRKAPPDPEPTAANSGRVVPKKVKRSVAVPETAGAEEPGAQPVQQAEAKLASTAPSVEADEPATPVVAAARQPDVTRAVAPQSTPDPVTPPQTPALWTMLGLARRELGHVVNAGAATTATATATRATSLVVPTVWTAATSPLGTPQQLTAEQVATATVNTLPVQLMKFVLRLGWMNTAQQQFAAVGGPDQANIDQLGDAVDEYAMGAAFQQQLLDSNDPTIVSQVWPGHSWYGQDVGGSRILYDNPDTIYRFMGVNAASSYVITGKFAGGVPADTNFSLLTGLSGVTADNLSGNDLLVNPDGTFTITVDSSPGVPGTNHIQLTSDSTLIAARNTLSDWNNQEPMSLSIQRIGGPPDSLFSQLGGFAIPVIGAQVASNPLLTTLVSLIPPLADPQPLLRGAVTAVVMILGLQMESTYIQVATTDPTTGKPTQPNVMSAPARNAQFLATQLQSAGYFQLANDQALVLTIDPGDAQYFVVPVTNDWTITDNYWDQQTSLNNVQALANPDDGVYTLVISPTDPDVANWVSTGGLNQGTISIRFQDLPLNPTHLPTVTSRVVSLDQLATVLPANTVYVTPEQRRAQIAARRAGFDNRFAPYPQV